MRDRILAEARPLSRLLTTSDAAKVLGLSRGGVWHLVREGDLVCEPTRSGQAIFHSGDVQRCLLKRADARSRPRSEVLATIHLRMIKAGIDPVQLSFLKGPGLRIVARGERSLHDRAVKGAQSFDNLQGSDTGSSVNRKAAGR
jgi:hypothetical protein